MSDLISIILPLISSGGIIFIIVEALITKRRETRNHNNNTNDKILDQIINQNNDLFAMMKSREESQDKQIAEITEELNTIENRLESHIKQETAINEALIVSMKKEEHNGDLDFAEHLVNMEKNSYKVRGGQYANFT